MNEADYMIVLFGMAPCCDKVYVRYRYPYQVDLFRKLAKGVGKHEDAYWSSQGHIDPEILATARIRWYNEDDAWTMGFDEALMRVIRFHKAEEIANMYDAGLAVRILEEQMEMIEALEGWDTSIGLPTVESLQKRIEDLLL